TLPLTFACAQRCAHRTLLLSSRPIRRTARSTRHSQSGLAYLLLSPALRAGRAYRPSRMPSLADRQPSARFLPVPHPCKEGIYAQETRWGARTRRVVASHEARARGVASRRPRESGPACHGTTRLRWTV